MLLPLRLSSKDQVAPHSIARHQARRNIHECRPLVFLQFPKRHKQTRSISNRHRRVIRHQPARRLSLACITVLNHLSTSNLGSLFSSISLSRSNKSNRGSTIDISSDNEIWSLRSVTMNANGSGNTNSNTSNTSSSNNNNNNNSISYDETYMASSTIRYQA